MSLHERALRQASIACCCPTGCVSEPPCVAAGPDFRRTAEDAVTAYLAAMAEGGWKLTPREPTTAMVGAVQEWTGDRGWMAQRAWEDAWDEAPAVTDAPAEGGDG